MLAGFDAADEGFCATCEYPDIARAYDLAGNADSAVAFLERYFAHPADLNGRLIEDGGSRAGSHKRLAELYDAKGDREKARSHYAQFIELWKNRGPGPSASRAEGKGRVGTASARGAIVSHCNELSPHVASSDSSAFA